MSVYTNNCIIDIHTLHFARNLHVSTEAQLILNKSKVYKILRIQISVVEKKEHSVQSSKQNVYFLMCICNYLVKSDTEAFFCFRASAPWFNV